MTCTVDLARTCDRHRGMSFTQFQLTEDLRGAYAVVKCSSVKQRTENQAGGDSEKASSRAGLSIPVVLPRSDGKVHGEQ